MRSHTHYLWFTTKQRQEIIDITDEVAAQVAKSGVQEGFVLVSAMHITASVFVNDHESGLGGHPEMAGDERRAVGPQALPSQRNGGGQRGGPSAQPDHWPRGHRADYGREARLRAVAAGVLRRVGRAAQEAGDHQSAWRTVRVDVDHMVI